MPPRRFPLALVVLVVVAAACTSSHSDSDIATVASTTSTSAGSTAPTSTTSTVEVGPQSEPFLPPGFELAFAEVDPALLAPPTTGPPTTTTAPTSTESTAPPTTGGSGGAPVTTIGGGPPADPGAAYRGVLGTLDANEPVAPAVADPPSVPAGVLPLTGQPGAVPSRPAAVVKIDNGGPARPQTGLNAADIVVEEEVEGGLTRFAAIFHSRDSIVGPVRSARTTDIGVLMGLGSPLLLYSGANGVTDALLLRRASIQNRSASRSSGYWRNRSRRAPSNLYSDTAPHLASAGGGPPPPQFAYRAPDTAPPANLGGVPTGELTVSYRANTVRWNWDGAAWLRSQGGRAHTVASGERVSAANVVVVETQRVDTGLVDSSGATVPEFVFVGTGRATVYTAGQQIAATWTRPNLAAVATLTGIDGSVVELTPGRTWIELVG